MKVPPRGPMQHEDLLLNQGSDLFYHDDLRMARPKLRPTAKP